jgi:transposase
LSEKAVYSLRRVLRELIETRDRLSEQIAYLSSVVEPEWSPGEIEGFQDSRAKAREEYEELLEFQEEIKMLQESD